MRDLFVFCQSSVPASTSSERLWFYKYKIELQSEAGQKRGRHQVLLRLHPHRKPLFSKMNRSPLSHYFPVHFLEEIEGVLVY